MKLSAPATITLRRPSADADLIISRHDDAVSSSNNNTVTERQVSYSDPGSASASSPEDSCGSQTDCTGRVLREKKKKTKKKGKRCVEERWRSGMRRASDCLREAVKRCQQQLQLCNDNKSKVQQQLQFTL